MSEPSQSSEPAEGSTGRLPLVEGALILFVALACLVFQLRLPGKLVDARDYQAVAAVLEKERQPGDVVLLYPWWTERARLFVPEGVPVVGYQGSDGDPLELHPRIWLLAEPELPRSSLSGLMDVFAKDRVEVGQERRFGNLSLRLFTNGRAHPLLFSMHDALPQAQVYFEGPDGSRTPCTWDGGRAQRCPNGSEVALEWHEISLQPRRCFKFYPPGGATKLVAEFSHVPATDTLALVGGYIWDRGSFKEGVSGSELALEVNGVRSALPMPAGLEGLQRVEAHATPADATVKVSVSAQSPQYRELCIELYGFGR